MNTSGRGTPRKWSVLVPTLTLAAVLTPGAAKPETWIEIRSPNFTVVGNGNDKQVRRVADEFEQFRAAFQQVLPKARLDLGKPMIVLAAKNEGSLRALLPEYWETKGRSHPAGIFISGEEKLYVALRTDSYGDFPYHIIYHEYIHALVRLNFDTVPVWVNEGLAEFYSFTTIRDKEVQLGRPDPNTIYFLREKTPLPLDVLFAVDHKSPYYNERDKTSIFYAESWALIHLLMVDEEARKGKWLSTYLDQLARGMDPNQAARQVFGDLKALEKRLNQYLRQNAFLTFKAKTSALVDEKQFAARTLSPAESAALRGDFHVHSRRPEEARALLDEALRLDPNNAQAHESMGLLYVYQGNHDEAMKWFDRAAELDSSSYIANYYSALAAQERFSDPQAFAKAEQRLLKALQINPGFVPAVSLLAQLYTQRDDKLEAALTYARRAAELEPGQAYHRLNLAGVLLRLQREDDAMAIARNVLATAKSDQERTMALSLVNTLEQIKQVKAAGGQVRMLSSQEAGAEEMGGRPALVRGTPASAPVEAPPAVELRAHELKLTGKQGVATGKVTAVVCGRTELALTLNDSGRQVKLFSKNLFGIEFRAYAQWTPPANFQPCEHLQGLRLKVNYGAAEDAEYAGEIKNIEILP